jgi:hypothetical protein
MSQEKVAVLLILNKEVYEALKDWAELLGCTISEAIEKTFQIVKEWDEKTKEFIAKKAIESLEKTKPSNS